MICQRYVTSLLILGVFKLFFSGIVYKFNLETRENDFLKALISLQICEKSIRFQIIEINQNCRSLLRTTQIYKDKSVSLQGVSNPFIIYCI